MAHFISIAEWNCSKTKAITILAWVDANNALFRPGHAASMAANFKKLLSWIIEAEEGEEKDEYAYTNCRTIVIFWSLAMFSKHINSEIVVRSIPSVSGFSFKTNFLT